MLDSIIRFSIKNKLIIGLFTLGLIVWGVYSAVRLPIDAVPDITNNQVQIITQVPTLGAQEVEQFITMPIELEVANIPNLIERRSISRSGISVITLVFKDDVDIYWARAQVSQQLTAAVPVDAIVRAEGKEYIFMQAGEATGEERSFRKVEVATGVTELGFTQITPVDELPEGAVIITKGAFYVLSKSQGGGEEE